MKKTSVQYKMPDEFKKDYYSRPIITDQKLNIKSLNKKGFKVMDIKLTFGQVGDDFTQALITVLIDFYCKRVPRFINPLHKNKKQ